VSIRSAGAALLVCTKRVIQNRETARDAKAGMRHHLESLRDSAHIRKGARPDKTTEMHLADVWSAEMKAASLRLSACEATAGNCEP
jgi:uncharacterized protein YchJ